MTTATAAPDVIPDWAAVAADVRCPLCDYNLRGLTDPRCPECGYQFAWAEVLSPPPTHPYLFECHPERNAWSFARTLAGSWHPREFWATLRPALRLNPARLAAYWFLSAALLAAGLLPTAVRVTFNVKASNAAAVGRLLATSPARVPPAVIARWDPPVTSWRFWDQVANRYRWDGTALVIAAVLVWPWVTFAALQVFAVSMRRAQVRRSHVARCVIYSCDFGPAVGLAAMALLEPAAFTRDAATPAVLLGGVALYTTYRLGTAYALHLRFHRPFLTALASQAIAFLLGLKWVLWVMGY